MVEQEINEIIKLVYNRLGYGLSESAYQRAMELELECRGRGTIREYYLSESYTDSKGRKHYISQLRADLMVFDLDVIIELKVISRLGDKERSQIIRYKKLAKTRYAVLVNFGKKLSVEWF